MELLYCPQITGVRCIMSSLLSLSGRRPLTRFLGRFSNSSVTVSYSHQAIESMEQNFQFHPQFRVLSSMLGLALRGIKCCMPLLKMEPRIKQIQDLSSPYIIKGKIPLSSYLRVWEGKRSKGIFSPLTALMWVFMASGDKMGSLYIFLQLIESFFLCPFIFIFFFCARNQTQDLTHAWQMPVSLKLYSQPFN